MGMGERTARMALCALQPMGNQALAALVAEDGAEAVWEGVRGIGVESRWGRRSMLVDPDAIVRATRKLGARFVIPGDEEWPTQVDDLTGVAAAGEGGAPLGLWIRGTHRLGGLSGAVALVGARAATPYGTHVAQDWAADLAVEGRVVVSGMAFGIDAAAHRGALGARRPTLALLACGVDIAYPTAHSALMGAVMANGAVVSEVPPGTRPAKVSFLARNRMIAALADGVVVVEAAARSGAKNTATWASELGRVVMAVPGPVTTTMSATPNRLIRDGVATLVSSPAEVIAMLSPLSPQDELPLIGAATNFDRLSGDCRSVREAMHPRESVGVAEVSARTGLSVPRCLSALDELSELGWVEDLGGHGALPRRRVHEAQA